MLYFAEYVAAEGWLGIVGRMALSAKTPLPGTARFAFNMVMGWGKSNSNLENI